MRKRKIGNIKPSRGEKGKSKKVRQPDSAASDFEDIDKVLECPVCVQHFLGEIYLCVAGHSVCEQCHKKLHEKTGMGEYNGLCPICRGPFSGARNFTLEDIIPLVALPCPYKENDCPFVGKGKARLEHKETCIHRPIRCLFHRCYPDCQWYGNPSNLLEHLDSHCKVRRVAALEHRIDVYWSYETREFCFTRGKDATFFVSKLDRIYYMSITRFKDQFHLAITWIPLSEEAAEEQHIYVEVNLPLVENQSITYTIKPRRMDSGLTMDENVQKLFQDQNTNAVPMKKW
eukprot:CAMPEP_0114519094 /NCGR_PEP_ID=MMETSP0109-20121206/18810_1 /TAXON_ID=29199 /ORGANISM="Chlorarachnion reptans, Strain CCCM449" /LENGTH=286 /DNA_ID=CAMNT_0001699791 /DNA_START=155 /DNA_END=1012 /DNA_ORIENTATION=-